MKGFQAAALRFLALAYGAIGRVFESRRGRHIKKERLTAPFCLNVIADVKSLMFSLIIENYEPKTPDSFDK